MKVLEKTNRLVKLLQALEKGWTIDEPVLFGRMGQHFPNTDHEVYHFVLRNKRGKTTLLSLPSTPELLAFLSENNIRVRSI